MRRNSPHHGDETLLYHFHQRSHETEKHFESLNATSLYCPKCKAAMPVVERLLLILPDGELYEYKCRRCGTSLGERKVTKKPEPFFVR